MTMTMNATMAVFFIIIIGIVGSAAMSLDDYFGRGTNTVCSNGLLGHEDCMSAYPERCTGCVDGKCGMCA